MFWTDLLFGLGVAVVLTAAFASTLRRRGPWTSTALFLLVVFLASWAGGVWLTPIGSRLWGVAWVPFVVAGIFAALVLAGMAALVAPPRTPTDVAERTEAQTRAFLALRGPVWFILFLLVLSILLHYAGSGL